MEALGVLQFALLLGWALYGFAVVRLKLGAHRSFGCIEIWSAFFAFAGVRKTMPPALLPLLLIPRPLPANLAIPARMPNRRYRKWKNTVTASKNTVTDTVTKYA